MNHVWQKARSWPRFCHFLAIFRAEHHQWLRFGWFICRKTYKELPRPRPRDFSRKWGNIKMTHFPIRKCVFRRISIRAHFDAFTALETAVFMGASEGVWKRLRTSEDVWGRLSTGKLRRVKFAELGIETVVAPVFLFHGNQNPVELQDQYLSNLAFRCSKKDTCCPCFNL